MCLLRQKGKTWYDINPKGVLDKLYVCVCVCMCVCVFLCGLLCDLFNLMLKVDVRPNLKYILIFKEKHLSLLLIEGLFYKENLTS